MKLGQVKLIYSLSGSIRPPMEPRTPHVIGGTKKNYPRTTSIITNEQKYLPHPIFTPICVICRASKASKRPKSVSK